MLHIGSPQQYILTIYTLFLYHVVLHFFGNLLQESWRKSMTALQAIIPLFILEQTHSLANGLWAHQNT